MGKEVLPDQAIAIIKEKTQHVPENCKSVIVECIKVITILSEWKDPQDWVSRRFARTNQCRVSFVLDEIMLWA